MLGPVVGVESGRGPPSRLPPSAAGGRLWWRHGAMIAQRGRMRMAEIFSDAGSRIRPTVPFRLVLIRLATAACHRVGAVMVVAAFLLSFRERDWS